MMISCFLVRENSRVPSRAHPSDAGMDVFYCPDEEELSKNPNGITLKTNDNYMFKSGVKLGIPHGYMVQVCNRGSMGAKRKLVVGAHIVDSGFSAEILIDLHNIGKEDQTIKDGDKIAQLVMIPVVHAIPLVAKNEESLYGMEQITMSDRGGGMLGSSDKKS